MRTRRVISCLLWGVGIQIARAAAPLYDSPAGGFAFTPPAGWEIKAESDEPFPTLSGPANDSGAPYVVIQAIRDQRDVFDLGDSTIKEMLKNPRYTLNLRDAFQTADKKFGLKFVFSVTVADSPTGPAASATPSATPPVAASAPAIYRQAYYLVAGPPGMIYAILVTAPDTGWKKYEPALDEMAKSYHLRPLAAASVKAGPAPSPALQKSTVVK